MAEEHTGLGVGGLQIGSPQAQAVPGVKGQILGVLLAEPLDLPDDLVAVRIPPAGGEIVLPLLRRPVPAQYGGAQAGIGQPARAGGGSGVDGGFVLAVSLLHCEYGEQSFCVFEVLMEVWQIWDGRG